MTTDEREIVTEALCRLSIATAGAEVDDARIFVYLNELDRYDASAVLQAVARLTHRATFFPAVGEIVAEIREVLGVTGEAAWHKAFSLVHADPDVRRGAFERDPALGRAVASVGGLDALRWMKTEAEDSTRRRFIAYYERLEPPLSVTAPRPNLRLVDKGTGGWARIRPYQKGSRDA